MDERILSKETKENFKNWLDGWDLKIESIDDFEEKEKMISIIEEASNFLSLQTAEWSAKSIEKDPTGEGLLSLFENPKYKDFNRISGNLLWVKNRINDLFEIKHRRTKQNFELRSKLTETLNEKK